MQDRSNKRVAKNTLVLYLRMIVTMLIGMWTSRIVINALGFTDQGLYNVVGGVIGFTSLITASISGSITRFLTYQIGTGDNEKLNKTVHNGITVQWILAIIILLLGETIGLWFVNSRLVIPEGRILAVNVVYQFAILNVIVGLVSSVPNALVIAFEKMNVYAWVSISNSLILFGVAIVISHVPVDRLIFYSFLQFLCVLGIRLFYCIYSKRNFSFITMKFGFEKDIFIPIFKFAGWNGIGTSASILRSSGTSVLLNMFGGPIANTINGIASSVNSLATVFVNDFTTAYTPQITKRYAAHEYRSLIVFIHQCSKFSYAMCAVMAIPVMFNIEPLLILWLKKIPNGVPPFAILIIIYSMIESISKPLINAKNATGNIRNYQIVVGGILLLTLPLTYIFLKFGFPLYYSYISILLTSIIAFVARIVMLRGSIPYWDSWSFIKSTVIPCLFATLASLILPSMLHYGMPYSIFSIFMQCILGVIWTSCCMFIIAMDRQEKKVLIGFVLKFLRFKIKNEKTY